MKKMNVFFHQIRMNSAFFTWLITSLFFCFQFILRSAPNAMATQLIQDFQINAVQFGFLSSAYYLPYSLMQVPVGIVLDMWGPKRALRIGTLVCVAGGIIFSQAYCLEIALLGRALIGAGAAVSFIGSVRMNTLWVPSAYLAFSIGGLAAVGKIGGAAANAILPILLSCYDSWHNVILFLAGSGLCISGLIWLFAKNGPKDKFISLKHESNPHQSISKAFNYVVSTPLVWSMSIYSATLYLTLTVFSDTYSIGFLSESLSITRIKAGWLAGMVGLGSAVGSFVITYLSDYFHQRLIFARICAFSTFILSLFIFFSNGLSLYFMGTLLFMFGFFSGGQVLAFVISTEYLPHYVSGMASGVTNAVLTACATIINPITGWLIQSGCSGVKIHGNPVYTTGNYRVGLMLLCLCFAVACFISLRIPETHPLNPKRHKA